MQVSSVGPHRGAVSYDCFSVTVFKPAASHFSQKTFMSLEKSVRGLQSLSKNAAAGQGTTFVEQLCHLSPSPRPCLADTYKGHRRGTFHKSTGRLGTWCPFGSHSSVLLGPCPRFRRRNDITQQPTEVKVWNMSYPESSAQTPLACWKLYELYVSSSVACGTPSFIRLKRQDVCWHWQLTQHVQQH